jgi:hypothetical protein
LLAQVLADAGLIEDDGERIACLSWRSAVQRKETHTSVRYLEAQSHNFCCWLAALGGELLRSHWGYTSSEKLTLASELSKEAKT